MSHKETFVVRPGKAGAASSVTTVTLPNGTRVHTLDRVVYDRAVNAANTVISRRGSSRPVSTESGSRDHERVRK